MEQYGQKPVFSSFLPGIAGLKGIPIWCYYVNRGQCVASFGTENKDKAIMEFSPAHVAYQNVKRTGFRTFLKAGDVFEEAFSCEQVPHEMNIEKNLLRIQTRMRELPLLVEVQYFSLPEERVGALVRKVTVTNLGEKPCILQMADGMPAIIPYGVGMDTMKNMTQTGKAWMQAEDVGERRPYFRVRASIEDTTVVRTIEGGNFALGFTEEGKRLKAAVDPQAVFAYDTSLASPLVFMEGGCGGVENSPQSFTNILPCCFFLRELRLLPGERAHTWELYGQVKNKGLLEEFLSKPLDGRYFEEKEKRARELLEELTQGAATRTGNRRFDDYSRYTYMDNILRGGYPIRLGNKKIFYVYSRKHGDLERDYNYFSMLPEYYSQGNGNFRDVNQNRRMDVFFSPMVERENLHTFYSLIQLDGYNPLGVEKMTFQLSEKELDNILGEGREELKARLKGPFTPGSLYSFLLEDRPEEADLLFSALMDASQALVNGSFGEGYWCDHWDYNLDLVEEYQKVYPEKEREMLYEKAYTWFLSQIQVNPRYRRYEETENGIRQYHALDEGSRRQEGEKLVRTREGRICYSTLMEKLLLLCGIKFSTLDPFGMGMEMEGGKPGWYDALNGMPALLGSSMAETCELDRMLEYTKKALEKYPGEVFLLEEVGEFLTRLGQLAEEYGKKTWEKEGSIAFWNERSSLREEYRRAVFEGVTGRERAYESAVLARLLRDWQRLTREGILRALKLGDGLLPTYFTYQVTDYRKTEEGILPLDFEPKRLPDFLEGPVRYLKLSLTGEEKQEVYERVKKSGLYDKKLGMYKVNDSLEGTSYELGRAKAFTPGWLENESIWLHMEYKYYLELLKSGLYREFFHEIKKGLIPFMDEEVYGRSTLENSSFLVSSKNPDERLHGRGFVARLSGSTVEFLNMWKIMMFGDHPFTWKEGKLGLTFSPAIPAYLMGGDLSVEGMFLGKTRVTYHFCEKKDYIPGEYKVLSMKLKLQGGEEETYLGDSLGEAAALMVRKGEIPAIEVCVC